ncbi:MAG: hypothetical protein ACLTT1_03375 [[Clostridium] scindens]
MRKVKKWCALLMASVMLAGTLTGCAVDEKTQENGSEQAGDEGKSDEGGKITKSEKRRQHQRRHRSQRDYQ